MYETFFLTNVREKGTVVKRAAAVYNCGFCRTITLVPTGTRS